MVLRLASQRKGWEVPRHRVQLVNCERVLAMEALKGERGIRSIWKVFALERRLPVV